MIHIFYTNRTSLELSPFHNQSSQMFWLLHATSPQSAQVLSFPVILWPWMKNKVIQIAIILWSFVICSFRPSLKEIGSQVSLPRPVLKAYSINSQNCVQ